MHAPNRFGNHHCGVNIRMQIIDLIRFRTATDDDQIVLAFQTIGLSTVVIMEMDARNPDLVCDPVRIVDVGASALILRKCAAACR